MEVRQDMTHAEAGSQPVPRATALEMADVSMVYGTKGGPVIALENVSFTVRGGEFVSIVGPSGCGKSTLLKLTVGLLQPTSGQIRLESGDKDEARDVGIVFQSPVLLPWRTILENVMLPAHVLGLPKGPCATKAHELLALVGLDGFEKLYPNQLSGGMQQRASIARALVYDPGVLLMDEPFGALDAMTREQMNLELQRIWSSSGKTILFVTHSIGEAVFLSDRVIVLSSRPGRILTTMKNTMPRQRSLDDMLRPEFGVMVKEVRSLLGAQTEGRDHD